MAGPSTFRPPPPSFEDGTVADAMRRGLVSCPPDTPLRVVAEMMSAHRIHCVVVRDDKPGAPAGWRIVTDLDLVTASALPVDGHIAAELASGPALTIRPEAPLREAAATMAREHVSHLVVVDSGSDRPLGVISTLDLAGALARRRG